MPFDLLSGPDVGGGFLFQLTAEPVGELRRVVVHAQEGGMDASAPPKGPITPLGFALDDEPCPIGGRECYHRWYEVEASQLGHARNAYNRLRFVLGPILDQLHGGASVPVEEGLRTTLARVIPALGPGGRPWFVGGSTAAFLQGVEVRPHDLDLGLERPDVPVLGEALVDFLIEPVARTSWGHGPPLLAGRAFVGTLKTGLRVEWGAPFSGHRHPGFTEWDRSAADVATHRVLWEGMEVPVARLEFFLVRVALKHDRKAVEETGARLRGNVDHALLNSLLDASPLAEPERNRVRNAAGA